MRPSVGPVTASVMAFPAAAATKEGAIELEQLVLEKRRVLAMQVDRLGTWEVQEGKWVMNEEEESAKAYQERRELMMALRDSNLSTVRRDPAASGAMQLMRTHASARSSKADPAEEASPRPSGAKASEPQNGVAAPVPAENGGVASRGENGDVANAPPPQPLPQPPQPLPTEPGLQNKPKVVRAKSLVRAEVQAYERRSCELTKRATLPPSGWPPGMGPGPSCEQGDTISRQQSLPGTLHRATTTGSIGTDAGAGGGGGALRGGLPSRPAQLPAGMTAAQLAAATRGPAGAPTLRVAQCGAAAASTGGAGVGGGTAALGVPPAPGATWGAPSSSSREPSQGRSAASTGAASSASTASAAEMRRVRPMKGVQRTDDDYALCVAAAYSLLGLAPLASGCGAAVAAAAADAAADSRVPAMPPPRTKVPREHREGREGRERRPRRKAPPAGRAARHARRAAGRAAARLAAGHVAQGGTPAAAAGRRTTGRGCGQQRAAARGGRGTSASAPSRGGALPSSEGWCHARDRAAYCRAGAL